MNKKTIINHELFTLECEMDNGLSVMKMTPTINGIAQPDEVLFQIDQIQKIKREAYTSISLNEARALAFVLLEMTMASDDKKKI